MLVHGATERSFDGDRRRGADEGRYPSLHTTVPARALRAPLAAARRDVLSGVGRGRSLARSDGGVRLANPSTRIRGGTETRRADLVFHENAE
jgi:hypothetical protein